MPYPQNLETAMEVEAVVRRNGAVPATIAILDGIPCVGVYLNFAYATHTFMYTWRIDCWRGSIK